MTKSKSDVISQVKFVKELALRLTNDLGIELTDAKDQFYSVPNGYRYANDIVRLRRELNKLRKMIVWGDDDA